METKRYEYAENIIDTKLFQQDELTFSVLSVIVNYKCRLVITDHERFVICHSCAPYPVWIWVPENITEAELEKVWQITKSEFSFDEGYGFNTKYQVAEYFIKQSRELKQYQEECNTKLPSKENRNDRDKNSKEMPPLGITMNLCTYDCQLLKSPGKKIDGTMSLSRNEDLEDVAYDLWRFKEETGVDREDITVCRSKAEALIQQGNLYLWRNEQGDNVAMCSYSVDGDNAKVTHVYTKPERRRKGYAENLVYGVTKLIKDQGYLPVLYTDADYAASNECYMRIGYELKGRLCTIAKIDL